MNFEKLFHSIIAFIARQWQKKVACPIYGHSVHTNRMNKTLQTAKSFPKYFTLSRALAFSTVIDLFGEIDANIRETKEKNGVKKILVVYRNPIFTAL